MEKKFICLCYSSFYVLVLGHLLSFFKILFILCSTISQLLSLVERGDFFLDFLYFVLFFSLFKSAQLHGSYSFHFCIFCLSLSYFFLSCRKNNYIIVKIKYPFLLAFSFLIDDDFLESFCKL